MIAVIFSMRLVGVAVIMLSALIACGVIVGRMKRVPTSVAKARRLMFLSVAGLAVGGTAYLALYFPATDALSSSERSDVVFHFGAPATLGMATNEGLLDRVFAVDRALMEARSARMWFLLNGLLLFIIPFGHAADVLQELARRHDDASSAQGSSSS